MRALTTIKPSIESVTVKRLLSFGNCGVTVNLQPLNVLIGANGSGKSNFLDILRLLQAAPTDISKPISRAGGISEWIWKGVGDSGLPTVNVAFLGAPKLTYQHRMEFGELSNRLQIFTESVGIYLSDQLHTQIFSHEGGRAKIATWERSRPATKTFGYGALEQIGPDDFDPSRSCLAQFAGSLSQPVLRTIAELYQSIGLYTDVNFGRTTPTGRAQSADLDQTRLFVDGSNMALVLNDLQNQPIVWNGILERLREFHPRIRNIITKVSYGSVQLYFEEDNLHQTIPATRMSDGTLRYLFLMALLLHPTPPWIICIEEPELGLHPDMVRSVAELLKDASTRTQVVVTTHSDLLVSALSEDPTAVLVCEHDGTGTSIRRLEADKLNLWLERYSLGDLWLKGEIGGTRW